MEKKDVKKPYQTPKLETYGDLIEVTKNGSQGTPDLAVGSSGEEN